jgi:hypothetical protein
MTPNLGDPEEETLCGPIWSDVTQVPSKDAAG